MNSLKFFATALLLAVSATAYAWDAPWDRNGHDRWGHHGNNNGFGDFWDDGFGDIFGDAFGDVDFEIKFRASGDGWGRGWGDNLWNGRNRYYNGYNGYNSYNNYRRGPYRGVPYGYGYPRYGYGIPYGSQPHYGYAPPTPQPAPAQRRARTPARPDSATSAQRPSSGSTHKPQVQK
jgi:hypothetical protein